MQNNANIQKLFTCVDKIMHNLKIILIKPCKVYDHRHAANHAKSMTIVMQQTMQNVKIVLLKKEMDS
jgi:hypothetical protein